MATRRPRAGFRNRDEAPVVPFRSRQRFQKCVCVGGGSGPNHPAHLPQTGADVAWLQQRVGGGGASQCLTRDADRLLASLAGPAGGRPRARHGDVGTEQRSEEQ